MQQKKANRMWGHRKSYSLPLCESSRAFTSYIQGSFQGDGVSMTLERHWNGRVKCAEIALVFCCACNDKQHGVISLSWCNRSNEGELTQGGQRGRAAFIIGCNSIVSNIDSQSKLSYTQTCFLYVELPVLSLNVFFFAKLVCSLRERLDERVDVVYRA